MQYSYKQCYLRRLWDHSADFLPLAHISGMHLLSWVREFTSALLPWATEDMLVTRFEKNISVSPHPTPPPFCVCILKLILPSNRIMRFLMVVSQTVWQMLATTPRLRFTGMNTHLRVCRRVKGGTVVVINMTPRRFLAPMRCWPKHVNLSHVTHKCH